MKINKKSKILVSLLGIMLITMTSAVLLLPWMIKSSILSATKEYTPYNANIEDVDVEFFSGRFELLDFTLQLKDRNVLRLSSVKSSWSWSSIFKGEVEITSFSMQGFKTSLDYEDNEFKIAEKKFDEVTKVEEGSFSKEKKTIEDNVSSIRIKNVNLLDLALDINKQDKLKIKKLVFSGLDFSKPNSPSRLEMDAVLNENQEISLSGILFPLNLSQESKLRLTTKNVDLKNLKRLATGGGFSFPDVEGLFEVDQQITISFEDNLNLSSKGSLIVKDLKLKSEDRIYQVKTASFQSKVDKNTTTQLSAAAKINGFSIVSNDEELLKAKSFIIDGLLVNLSDDLNLTLQSGKINNLELPTSEINKKSKSIEDSQISLSNLNVRIENLENSKIINSKGNVGEYGKYTLVWKQNKDQPKKYEQTTLDLKSINLTDFSSIITSQIGYRIEKGKLDGKYTTTTTKEKLVKGKLDLTFLDFELDDENEVGKEIAEDKGMPLATMISMVKDDEKKIHLKFPIEGKADSPEFGLRKILGKTFGSFLLGQLSSALTNVVVQSYLPMLVSSVALSPASILALGKAGYDFLSKLRFEPIDFKSKSPELTEKSQKQLLKVATILKKRPGVTLNFCPIADYQEIYPEKEVSAAEEVKDNKKVTAVLKLASKRMEKITDYLIKEKSANPSQVISCKPRISVNQPAKTQVEITF